MPTNKQRREAERPRLQRQLERRRAKAVTRRRQTLLLSIIGTVVIIGLIVFFVVQTNSDDKKPKAATKPHQPKTTRTTSPTPTPSVSTTPPALDGKCTFPTSGTAARKVTKPASTQPTKGTVDIDVKTTRGDMTFQLDRATAPCTVGSFVSLVKQKYFDKTPCPRVEDTGLFILQCGDPTGTGKGGPGYTVPDEYTGSEKYTTGTLAMANTGAPDSGGSQFFIVYKTDQLPPNYTIFGKVTKGLDVVTKVGAGGDDGSNSAGGGKPKLPISITSMTVAKSA